VALNGAEILLEAGRVGGLLGANGAGKSVLSATLAGEINPDEEQATVLGRAYTKAVADAAILLPMAAVS
jgi:ABC-type multidrug transport system ATPase subunit